MERASKIFSTGPDEVCCSCGVKVCTISENFHQGPQAKPRTFYLDFESIEDYQSLNQVLSDLNINRSSRTISFGEQFPESAPGERVKINNGFLDSFLPIFKNDLESDKTDFVIVCHLNEHNKVLFMHHGKKANICHVDPRTGLKTYNNTEFFLENLYLELEKGKISIPYNEIYSNYILFEATQRNEIENEINRLLNEKKLNRFELIFKNRSQHFISLIIKHVGMPTCRAVLRSLENDHIKPREKDIKARLVELCKEICDSCWRRILQEMKRNSVKTSAIREFVNCNQRPMFRRYEISTDMDVFYLYEREWVAPEVDVGTATEILGFIHNFFANKENLENKIGKYKFALLIKYFMQSQPLGLSLSQIQNIIQDLIKKRELVYRGSSLQLCELVQNELPEELRAQRYEIIKFTLVNLLKINHQGIPLHNIKSVLREKIDFNINDKAFKFRNLTELLTSIPGIIINPPKNNPIVRYSEIILRELKSKQ